MSQPYDVPGGAPHDPAEWEWVDLGSNGGYWVLRGSDDKGYNCTEYAMAKIEGRPPRWGGNESQTTETDEIEQRLRDLGFRESAVGTCGSGSGQMSQCVVLYFDKSTGRRGAQPFHVEVYDPAHRDWGGKGSPGLPIRHRQDPTTFPTDPAQRALTEIVFLCRRSEPNAAAPRTASWLHQNARNLDRQQPPDPPGTGPVPPVPPYLPSRLHGVWRVIQWLAAITVGWLLHAWLM